MNDLWRLSARAAIALLDKGEISPLDLVAAALARREAVGAKTNALVTWAPERARAQAHRLMKLPREALWGAIGTTIPIISPAECAS